MPDVMEMFQLYKNDVYRLAISYLHSIQESEDVCQNVFLKAMQQKNITDGKEKAWLMKVTANECKSILRSNWWKKTEELDDTYEATTQRDDFTIAIEHLLPKYRVVIYLFYYEEYSTEEIAKILNINRSAVTTRLSRARQILKKDLKEE